MDRIELCLFLLLQLLCCFCVSSGPSDDGLVLYGDNNLKFFLQGPSNDGLVQYGDNNRQVVCECEQCYVTQCPDGWMYYKGSCYLFVDNLSVDWTEATHHCDVQHGAKLATIEGKAEDLFLQGFLMKLFRNHADRDWHTGTANPFWLGATDEVVEGVWTWYTDDSDVDQGYSNWAPNQPDRHDGHDEDCLYMYGPSNFTWHDGPCTDKGHPLCELQ